MKKSFIVEVDYEELSVNVEGNSEVFTDLDLGIAVEKLMEGYKKTGSIQGKYTVEVKQLIELQKLKEENNRLKERLQISPYGDDKIDELESAIEHLRFQLENK